MTTKNQHTAGPWVLCDVHYVQKDSDGGIIARVHGSNAECQANARLITASPELLEALQGLLAEANCYAIESRPKLIRLCDAARSAIYKATHP